ncbi:hypothetical protein TI05_15740 [Achromatium sp. WMS3]|nr:hypothetical protein TI05_15740 [Achromatium sp. WMS3]
MMIEMLVNILAILCSSLAMFQLSFLALKMQGQAISKVFNYLVLGIFFSVFVHASVELIATFGVFKENILMLIMGGLITLGSIFFVIAGIEGSKHF